MQQPIERRDSTRGWRRSLILAIAATLVLLQTNGLHHRVAHGTATGWSAGHSHEAAIHAEPTDPDAHEHGAGKADDAAGHDCAALDALALGGGPPHAAPPIPASSIKAARIPDLARPFLRSFSLQAFQARAPPALLR